MIKKMDIKSLKALIEAGAIKKIRVVGEGSHFYMEIITQGGPSIVNTLKGKLKKHGRHLMPRQNGYIHWVLVRYRLIWKSGNLSNVICNSYKKSLCAKGK